MCLEQKESAQKCLETSQKVRRVQKQLREGYVSRPKRKRLTCLETNQKASSVQKQLREGYVSSPKRNRFQCPELNQKASSWKLIRKSIPSGQKQTRKFIVSNDKFPEVCRVIYKYTCTHRQCSTYICVQQLQILQGLKCCLCSEYTLVTRSPYTCVDRQLADLTPGEGWRGG